MPEHSTAYADMHTHTTHSPDGRSSPDEMCESAYRQGLLSIDISDHCDVNRNAELHCFERSTKSITDALRLKGEYDGKVKVLCGIEIGNAHWDIELANKCAAIKGIDCIIGSVHRIMYEGEEIIHTKADFGGMTHDKINGICEKYFADILEMLDVIKPDILAHPTYTFRYMVGKHGLELNVKDYSTYVDRILKRLISCGTALEVNTSIVQDKIADYDIYVLERYYELGGRLVTLGSDAHEKTKVANAFDIAAKELCRIGFGGICEVEERRINFIKL